MYAGKPFCVAPQMWQDGMTRYPPQESCRWNGNCSLQSEDLDDAFFLAVCDLEKSYNDRKLTEANFVELELTFSLPMANGKVYDLIPNGKEIVVTRGNAWEYFQRMREEYRKIQQRSSANEIQTRLPVKRPSGHPLSSIVHITEADLASLDWIESNAVQNPRVLTFPGDERLRWAVLSPNTGFMLRLRPQGEYRVVEQQHLAIFVDALLATIAEVRRAIRVFGSYPPPIAVSFPTDSSGSVESIVRENDSVDEYAALPHRRDRGGAATPAELEKQRALFSPTHDTGGILAPFQELNL